VRDVQARRAGRKGLDISSYVHLDACTASSGLAAAVILASISRPRMEIPESKSFIGKMKAAFIAGAIVLAQIPALAQGPFAPLKEWKRPS
jgi:hypothetical protein